MTAHSAPFKLFARMGRLWLALRGGSLDTYETVFSLACVLGQHSQEADDTISFMPYTYWGHKKKRVDPVNIVVAGLLPKQVAEYLIAQDGAWYLWEKSHQFLYVQRRWVTSWTQLIRDLPGNSAGHAGMRYHVRLFAAYSKRGIPVTIGAAHMEHDDGGHQILSWDAAREDIAWTFAREAGVCFSYNDLCEPNWRYHEGDGKAAFVYMYIA